MSISNEQLLAFVKKHPVGVGCGLLSLLLAITLYFRSDAIPTARAQLEQKTIEGERLAANLRNATYLKEQYDEVAASNKMIQGRLVRGSQLAMNLQYFYKLEADTGTKLVSLNQASVTAKGTKANFSPVGFTVTVQGTYAQLNDFLRRLEHGLHICRVLSASCSTTPESAPGGATLLMLNLNLELLGQP